MHLAEIKQTPTSIDISRRGIDNLRGSPQYVDGNFNCSFNYITSLRSGPKKVTGNYICVGNRLPNLQWAPVYVGALFDCGDNNIDTLHDIHKIIKHCLQFSCENNPIDHSVLGLLLIDGLQFCWLGGQSFQDGIHKTQIIINKYLSNNNIDKFTRMIQCQDELIEHGLERFARL